MSRIEQILNGFNSAWGAVMKLSGNNAAATNGITVSDYINGGSAVIVQFIDGVPTTKLTAAQIATIPVNSDSRLMVYQSDGTAGWYGYNGSAWVLLVGSGGGGTVQSVSGANVDNTDPANPGVLPCIPLEGTQVWGNGPVTGAVRFANYNLAAFVLIEDAVVGFNVGVSDDAAFNGAERAYLKTSRDTLGFPIVTAELGALNASGQAYIKAFVDNGIDGIFVTALNAASRGISSDKDFSANITANDFTQKAYVDKITTGGAGGAVFSYPAYADDAAAGLGGLTTGQVYQTDGSNIAFPFVGVVMVKQ